MHGNRAGDRSFGQETGVPPIAGTPCSTIQADLERDDEPDVIVILARRQHHHHLAAFKLRFRLDLGDGRDFLAHLVQKLHAEFHVRHLAATETQCQLDLVAFLEEAANRLHLGLVVMAVDVRAHLDLLDLDDLLVLARLGRLLLVGVFQLAEIEDLYDGRYRIGRYLNEIEPGLFGEQQCVVDGNIAAVLAFGVDKLDPGNPDVTVGARPILGRRRCFERSANGRGLLGRFVQGLQVLMRERANVVSARAESIAQH